VLARRAAAAGKGGAVCAETGLASVNTAWHLIITHGTTLASMHGIMPQDLILGN